MNSLNKNHTFTLVKKQDNFKVLKNRWIYKLKIDPSTNVPRYKARLVVKGFAQRQGIDFEEIFSPVVKMTSIRLVLGLAAAYDLEIEQMDVKTAFLHGDLQEDIYMQQPEGFEVEGKETLVCKLQKSLYGLKQAPRQWYIKFESFMEANGFKKTLVDHCVFTKDSTNDNTIILLLYADDMLIIGKDQSKIASLKKELNKAFEMKDLGAANHILGVEIIRDRSKGKI
ncbi:transmembrane signal receptor [Lithospermum erythrorhizon]|uniref:Transmembrane signal receptor n=1 Tax=Lithospermum erythrorhizon TaxID=34254 RepID=A0AAV3Q790_LITER